MSDEPLFTPRGADFLPSEHTRGPWDPRHQHGGAVAALAARAVERTAGAEFCVTRLTVELMRPVPLEPLAVDIAVPRPGRRVLGITVSVSAGDLEVEVVRAHAVAIRRAELPTGEGHETFLEPGPQAGIELPFGFEEADQPAFHRTGMEVRFVDGGADRPGPAKAWFRLQRPVVGDEQPSGVQRAAAAADFGNGISWVLPFERWIFLNPDLTLHLARPPVGEWIGLDALTLPSDQGMAMAESALYDDHGRLGRAVQSLLLQRRDP
jgi:Acyl-CoA thioesterase C-terminal domain/Acyl-CoA thioesterase N-terminal domain